MLTYVNYFDGGEQERVAAAYSARYACLARFRATHDPTSLFRMNQNVKQKA